MATLPEPGATTRLPSKDWPAVASISRAKYTVPYPVASVRTCEPPTEMPAGEHPGLVAVGDALVLPEQVADLTPADADVTRRHVGVLADVPVEARS